MFEYFPSFKVDLCQDYLKNVWNAPSCYIPLRKYVLDLNKANPFTDLIQKFKIKTKIKNCVKKMLLNLILRAYTLRGDLTLNFVELR